MPIVSAGPGRRQLFYGMSFFFLGVAALYLATAVPRLSLQLLVGWCALSLLIVGVAYIRSWPRVFGKTENGRLGATASNVMAPWLLLTGIVWRLQNLFVDPQPWSRITPNLFVGRRCEAVQLPPNTTLVLDVTCEFPTPRSVRDSVPFLCSPTLDGCAPTFDQCRSAFDAIPWSSQPVVYV